VIVGIRPRPIRRKPVLTYASIIFGGMLASVNSVNSVVAVIASVKSPWRSDCAGSQLHRSRSQAGQEIEHGQHTKA